LDATGLMFYNARYYDSTLGRFISPDMIVPGAGSPQTLNRFSYALNNPLKYIDPNGHDSQPPGYACGLGIKISGCEDNVSSPTPTPTPAPTTQSITTQPLSTSTPTCPCWESNDLIYSGPIHFSTYVGSNTQIPGQPDYYSDYMFDPQLVGVGPAAIPVAIDLLLRTANAWAPEAQANNQHNLFVNFGVDYYESGVNISQINIANASEHGLGVLGIQIGNSTQPFLRQSVSIQELVPPGQMLSVSMDSSVYYSNYDTVRVNINMRSWTHSIAPFSFNVKMNIPGIYVK